MKEYVIGYWHKIQGRCMKCGRVRDRLYEIKEGPVTGMYCGRFCYEAEVQDKKDNIDEVGEKVKELKGET